MSATPIERPWRVLKVECDDGRSFVIYNAAVLANPSDHEPDKWYVRPYPVRLDFVPAEPFDTPEEAEQSVRARPTPGADGVAHRNGPPADGVGRRVGASADGTPPGDGVLKRPGAWPPA